MLSYLFTQFYRNLLWGEGVLYSWALLTRQTINDHFHFSFDLKKMTSTNQKQTKLNAKRFIICMQFKTSNAKIVRDIFYEESWL